MDTRSKVFGSVALSVGIAVAILFWEWLLAMLNMRADSDELILGWFYVGNSWPWNAALGLFGIVFIYVATTDRWGLFENTIIGEVLAVFGTMAGLVAAFVARAQPTNALLGWKGLATIFVSTAVLAYLAFAKDHARNTAMGFLGLALGISLYVGAAAGAFVTVVMLAAFFVGFLVDTFFWARKMSARM